MSLKVHFKSCGRY